MPGTPSVFPQIKTPEKAIGDLNEVTTTMSADQWQAIAAVQQQRLFAIHDIATRALEAPSKNPRHREKLLVDAGEIRDLCKLPHNKLVVKGLMS